MSHFEFEFCLLLTISDFALGNEGLIREALKAGDIEELESVLKNTEAKSKVDYNHLKHGWDNIIKEALETSPETVLPLLKFGYEHEFHLRARDCQRHFSPKNLGSILELKDEMTIIYAIKYYDVINEEGDKYYHDYKLTPIDTLNLLLKDRKSVV